MEGKKEPACEHNGFAGWFVVIEPEGVTPGVTGALF